MKVDLYNAQLDSTILEYDRVAEQLPADTEIVVRAGTQTTGRGRDKNTWHSPRGGLWFTFNLQYPQPVPSFSLYVGYCLHRVLTALLDLQCLRIKWPNDLMLQGRKLAGIICTHNAHVSKYLISIGMNTNVAKDEVLNEYSAAILSDIVGFNVSNTMLQRLLIKELQDQLTVLTTPQVYIDYCNAQLFGRGAWAEIDQGDKVVSGWLGSVDAAGALLIRANNGDVQQLVFGNLRLHSRP